MHQSYPSIAFKSSLSSSSYGRIMIFGAQICGKNSPIEEVTKRPLILGSKMSLEFKIGRRESLLLLPLLFVGPISARGETAPMGADTLDRPGFRQYQDLTKQEPSADSSQNVKDMTIPVNGRQKKLSKLLGSRATIVMNVKLDDPETTAQVPALRGIVAKYAEQGLTALCFPTDQGDYEPDDSTTVRIKVNIHPCTTPPARSRSPSAPPPQTGARAAHAPRRPTRGPPRAARAAVRPHELLQGPRCRHGQNGPRRPLRAPALPLPHRLRPEPQQRLPHHPQLREVPARAGRPGAGPRRRTRLAAPAGFRLGDKAVLEERKGEAGQGRQDGGRGRVVSEGGERKGREGMYHKQGG